MLGYHIEVGYNGAINNGMSYDEMWETLKRKAREISDKPHEIIAEARRLGSPESCSRGLSCCSLDTYADNYSKPFDSYGHPISIIEDGDTRQIMQLASTDDEIKYHVRRAFVRLLIEAMHRERIEVSLSVV